MLPPPTAFEIGTHQFGMLIMRLTILLVLFVLLVNAAMHKPLLESFMFALALAVGLTPELLPMVVSITLSRGALLMAKKRVIVKRLDNERKTASGIVIPDSAAEKPDQGEVLAVGPGKKTEEGRILPPDVKVGDKVLFGKYAGQSVKVDGDEVLVIREEEILAVIL